MPKLLIVSLQIAESPPALEIVSGEGVRCVGLGNTLPEKIADLLSPRSPFYHAFVSTLSEMEPALRTEQVRRIRIILEKEPQ